MKTLDTTTIPKISIIMAACNEEKAISRAIDSIRAQTFNDWELIVIDDGSKDKTVEVMQSSVVRDSRIRLILNATNMGLPASLNKAITLARADLIARADADDVNLPERLSKQYAYMQAHPEIDVLGTAAYLLDAYGNRVSIASLPQTHGELETLPFLKTHFFHPSVMIRRRFFEVAGLYDSTYSRAQDKELWLRGLTFGCKYANLQEPLIEYSTDGYVRSWRSIKNRILSLLRMVRRYKIKRGYLLILVSIAYSSAIKMNIYKPNRIGTDVS